MKKPLIKKANKRKIALIKKYAQIRLKKLWNEWGFSKEEFGMLIGTLSIFVGLFALYIVGYIFI